MPFWIAPALALSLCQPQGKPDELLTKQGLTSLGAYSMLFELTTKIGGRPGGSPQAAAAVEWGKQKMLSLGFQNVHLEPCKTPHWVRGDGERAFITAGVDGEQVPLAMCALGGSVATPAGGLTAEVIEVKSLEEASRLGDKAKGKIVFYNRAFDGTKISTFAQYGGANDQRTRGASVAAKVGAIAVFVRSMSTALDDNPHTGAMRYSDDAPKIPAAAISTLAANRLTEQLKRGATKVHLEMFCQTLPDVDSFNVVGEVVGTEKPEEVIVVGGHLDSWDLAQGAHDDGSGVCQSMEALSLIKQLSLQPKRTIRAVLFMDEEFGGSGARAFAAVNRGKEKCIVGMESDSGGFTPRSFGVSGSDAVLALVRSWLPMFEPLGIDRIDKGGGGSDVGPLGQQGAVTIGYEPDGQRYFDYHHSKLDTIDKVSPREVELGAIAMAIMLYQIAQNGLPK